MKQGSIFVREGNSMRVVLETRRRQMVFYRHELDWSKTVFVAIEKHWRATKIKEAFLINAFNPTKNV